MNRKDTHLDRPGVFGLATATFGLLAAIAGCQDQATPAAGPDSEATQTDHQVGESAHDSRSTRVLFDGRSLGDWKITGFGGQENIHVADGAIVAEAGYPLAGINYEGDELPTTDYSIFLQAKKIDGTDFFCCVTFPVKQEFCSLVVGGWGGPVTGISCIDGSDAADNQTRSLKKYHPGRWYSIQIDVTDDRIACRIDGEVIVDLPRAGISLSLRNEVTATRPLGICAFETESAWRDIRLIQPAAWPEIMTPETTNE